MYQCFAQNKKFGSLVFLPSLQLKALALNEPLMFELVDADLTLVRWNLVLATSLKGEFATLPKKD